MSHTKIVVHGVNYEGAHFRGIASDTDDKQVLLTVEGEEQQVVNYLLSNFSYGPDESVATVADLVVGLANNNIPIFDGCGGILKISTADVNPTVLLDISADWVHMSDQEDIDAPDHEEPPTPLDLGLINVDELDEKDHFGHVNDLVAHLIEGPPDPQ